MLPAKSLAAALALVSLSAPAWAQTDTAAPATPAPVEDSTAPVAPVRTSGIITANAAITLTLDSATDIERKLVSYQCDDGGTLAVQYINAAPNFIAIVPVDNEAHLFATALSASGARYISGPFEWWTKGDEATLRDLTQGEDAKPLATCSAITNTP